MCRSALVRDLRSVIVQVEESALRFFEVVSPAGREAAVRFAFWASLCRVPAACIFGARAVAIQRPGLVKRGDIPSKHLSL